MNSERANIWLCKAFALAFILNVLGIRQSHALYSPVYEVTRQHNGVAIYYTQ